MWKRTRRVWLLTVVALAGSALSALPAAAKSSRGLVFPQGPLTVSWKQLERTKKIRVCNGGRIPARLELRLSGFGFRRTDSRSGAVRRYAPGRVLSVRAPAPVRPGSCASVSLAPTGRNLLVDAGEYSGTIVATAAALGVIRQKLTVLGPGQVGRTATVSSPVEEQQLEARNSFHSRSPQLVTGDLLLGLPPDGLAPPALGAGCEKLASGGWSRECAFIGNLYHGDDVIHVYLAGPVGTDQGVARLPIRVEGANAVGDYEGVLDPAGNGVEAEAVAAKLNLTDSVWSAILALLIGTGVGGLIELWYKRWRLKSKLLQRAAALVGRYAEAGRNAGAEIDYAKLSLYAADVEKAIAAYSASTLLLDKDSHSYKQIEASLAKAEEDARLLGAPKGLKRTLFRFRKKVSAVEELLNENRLVKEVPELLTRARALLGAGDLAVGDATAQSVQADDLGSALDLWRLLAQRLLAGEAWLFAICKKDGGRVDESKLGTLPVRLRALHEELFAATGKEDLDRLRTSGRFELLESEVAYLGATQSVEKPEPDAWPVELLRDAIDEVKAPFQNAYMMGKDKRRRTVELPSAEGSLDYEAATAVEFSERRLRFVVFDALTMLLAAAVAIVGGLGAFYFGKTWGTWEDYLLVIFAGAGTQVLLATLLDRVSIFLHDLSPVSTVAPARLTVKSAASSR